MPDGATGGRGPAGADVAVPSHGTPMSARITSSAGFKPREDLQDGMWALAPVSMMATGRAYRLPVRHGTARRFT
jgi:hypothetical protein